MFELLLVLTAAIAIGGVIVAYDGSRDVFHPLVFVGPMFAFLYGWMPWKLLQAGGLARFFDGDQILTVQTLYLAGVLAFVLCCLSVGVRVKAQGRGHKSFLSPRAANRLLVGAAVSGLIGLTCWGISIVNVGGFVNAFSASYSGGWDDSGYVRDGSLLLLVGVLLSMMALSAGGRRLPGIAMVALFGVPWASSALLMGRRGPTFALVVVLSMGWYINRRKRPPLFAVAVAGICLGWLALFLVTNRSSIYLGSSFDVKTDVANAVEKPDTGNEYIYGTGTVIASQKRDHYFWMRRYLAQVMVRPIPSAIWPTKYADFGVPELLVNAGTGEGFGDALGWVGAPGSAPGIVADLFVEVWWLAVPAMGLLGFAYGFVWKRAVQAGGGWSAQYVVLSALSIYLVMQTMEAVIFRTLLLSVPCWLSFRWALRKPAPQTSRLPARPLRLHEQEATKGLRHA